jgi:erythromycin esterase-like protein
MRVPEGRDGSWEDVLHRTTQHIGSRDALLVFDGSQDGGIPQLDSPIAHRAIGVVYDPEHERWGNYVPSVVPRRYDAFVFVDESRALDPLHLPVRVDGELPETFPSGV